MRQDNEADHAAEGERLRAELAEFVLDALAQRAASGEQPQLAQAIADAIDRRVEQAVAARVGQVQFPDPDSFADQVIAAAAARGFGGGEPPRLRARSGEEPSVRRSSGMAIGNFSRLHIILISIIVVIIGALATYFVLNRGGAPTRSETVNNVTFITPEPTPDGGSNVVLPPPTNGAEPAPPARDETRRR